MSLDDPAYLHAARTRLAALDTALAHAHGAVQPLVWRRRPAGFAGLTRMIVDQQVSVQAAAAIWRKLESGLGTVAPETVLAAAPETLRGLGLSSQKARYVRGAALAVEEGRLDFDRLPSLPDDEAVARLTALTGVGLWTAQIYLMFCEGRLDFFPAADIALQEALRHAERADARLHPRRLTERAEAWRPHRSVAAHLLWGYYLTARGRSGNEGA